MAEQIICKGDKMNIEIITQAIKDGVLTWAEFVQYLKEQA